MMKMVVSANENIWERIRRLRINRVEVLAPKMQEAIEKLKLNISDRCIVFKDSIGEKHLVRLSDFIIWETQRTDELQGIYYRQGTTKARTATGGWHWYCLAFDGISNKYEWFNNANAKIRWPNSKDRERVAYLYFNAIADIAKTECGLDWGGDWKSIKDFPHFQWGTLKPSPSSLALDIVNKKGLRALWEFVGAI